MPDIVAFFLKEYIQKNVNKTFPRDLLLFEHHNYDENRNR